MSFNVLCLKMKARFKDTEISLSNNMQEIGRRHLCPSNNHISRNLMSVCLNESGQIVMKSARDIRVKRVINDNNDHVWTLVRAGQEILLGAGSQVEVLKDECITFVAECVPAHREPSSSVPLLQQSQKEEEKREEQEEKEEEEEKGLLSENKKMSSSPSYEKLLSPFPSLSASSSSIAAKPGRWMKVIKSQKRSSAASPHSSVPLEEAGEKRVKVEEKEEVVAGVKVEENEAGEKRVKVEEKDEVAAGEKRVKVEEKEEVVAGEKTRVGDCVPSVQHFSCQGLFKARFFIPLQLEVSAASDNLGPNFFAKVSLSGDEFLLVGGHGCLFPKEGKLAFWVKEAWKKRLVCQIDMLGLEKPDPEFWVAVAFKQCNNVGEDELLDFFGGAFADSVCDTVEDCVAYVRGRKRSVEFKGYMIELFKACYLPILQV